MKAIKIGQEVTRIKPTNDYTYGRKGIVVEINPPRIRVNWLTERNGTMVTTCNSTHGKGIRTWVNERYIE